MSRKSSSKTTAPKSTKGKSVEEELDYNEMKVTELKALCKKRKISTAGNKIELVKRLSGAKVTPKSSKTSKVSKKKVESDASASEEEEPVPKKKTVRKVSAKAKKVESEDDSVSEEKPAKKTTKKPAKKVSEDEDASASEEKPVKVKKSVKKVVVESEENDASSEEEKPVKKTTKKPVKKAKVVSEDEASSEEKPVKSKSSKKTKKVVESDEEASSELKKPTSRKKVEKEESDVEEENDESSTVENQENQEEEKDESSVADDAVRIHPDIVDKDISAYHVSPLELFAVLHKAFASVGVEEDETREVCRGIADSLRSFGCATVEHIKTLSKGKQNFIPGTTFVAVGPKSVPPPSPKKKVQKEKEEVSDRDEETEKDEEVPVPPAKKEPAKITYNEIVGAFCLGDFAMDYATSSAVGRLTDNGVIPLTTDDANYLMENKIRFLMVDEQELDDILTKNTESFNSAKGQVVEEDAGTSEGGDDGVETVPDNEDPVVLVENGLDEITERTAPNIDEAKFTRFVSAQNSMDKQTDYIAISKKAGLTEEEGMEIMSNYKAYNNKFPHVITNVKVKKVPAPSPAKSSKPVARKIIK